MMAMGFVYLMLASQVAPPPLPWWKLHPECTGGHAVSVGPRTWLARDYAGQVYEAHAHEADFSAIRFCPDGKPHWPDGRLLSAPEPDQRTRVEILAGLDEATQECLDDTEVAALGLEIGVTGAVENLRASSLDPYVPTGGSSPLRVAGNRTERVCTEPMPGVKICDEQRREVQIPIRTPHTLTQICLESYASGARFRSTGGRTVTTIELKRKNPARP